MAVFLIYVTFGPSPLALSRSLLRILRSRHSRIPAQHEGRGGRWESIYLLGLLNDPGHSRRSPRVMPPARWYSARNSCSLIHQRRSVRVEAYRLGMRATPRRTALTKWP